jgi:hypothetical protein
MKILKLKKRHKILLGIIVFITLLLFAVPRAGRWYIVKHSHEWLGRRLEIDRIRFNYFTGTLLVNNLRMFEADAKTVFFSFNRMKIKINYLHLFKNEIFVKYIILDSPYARVLQDGNIFNFSDLMKSDSSEVMIDTVPQKPVKYIINNISITRGFVKYTDQALDNTISINNVDLNIPGFTWSSDSTRMGIDFRFIDGGRLFSNLSIDQADSTYSINLKLDSLNLDIIEPYIKSYLNISALHGYLSNDIIIKGDLHSLFKLSVNGMNHIYAFQLLDSLKRTIFSFEDLAIDIDTLLLERNRLAVNSIELKKPIILFELVDTTNNWLALIKPSAETGSDTLQKHDENSGTQAESSFRFSRLDLSEGKINISDKTLRYPFEYLIDNIRMTSSPDAKMPGWIDVGMSAVLNGAGNLRTDFAMNPKNSGDLDISLSIEQFRMKDMEAYFRHYFGFPVTGGRMNFSSQNRLRANSLVSNNSLFFRKFTLGKRSEEKAEYNIPLRLALGVMSDKDGIIDVKTPVEMKGEDVKVGNIRKIIFHAIGTLFIKAAVSPVNLLGDLFKADPEALKEIHLTLTDPSPDKKNMESVDILADILNKKPELSLDIVYCIDPEKTSDSLAHLIVSDDFARINNSSANTSMTFPDSILSKYILGKMPADSLLGKTSLSELCRKYLGDEKLKVKIDSLKISQTTFLQNYLSRDKEIPAERYRIIETMPDSIKHDSVLPSFRIYFNAGE